MALKTLNNKIFCLVASLLCLTSMAILAFVWLSSIDHVKFQLNRDLTVGKEIFTQSFNNTETQLYSSARALAADNSFKQILASSDSVIVADALKNHSERISADLMTLISLKGKLIASISNSVSDKLPRPNKELIKKAIDGREATTFLLIDNKLYQIILFAFDTPKGTALAQIGFEIDLVWAENLKKTTQLDVIVQVKAKDDLLIISTLPDIKVENILSKKYESDISLFNRSEFLSKNFVFYQSNEMALIVTLAEDSTLLFGELDSLFYKVLLITLLAIGSALLSVAVFSKKLTRPLSLLSTRVSSLSSGEYMESLPITANTEEITNLIRSFDKMQLNIKQREEKITYQASHDLLTGLYNRFKISDLINEKFNTLEGFTVIGFNINDFRSVNDTFGHSAGDTCILTIANRLKNLDGLSARLNGSEMILLTDKAFDRYTLSIIKKDLEKPITAGKVDIRVSLAVSKLLLPRDANTVEEVFRRCSLTLDKAKKRADHYIDYSHALEKDYIERLNILALLKEALLHDSTEFSMAYQPKLHYSSNTVNKSEALLRWNSAKIGFVSPELFIPIAEQAGLIHKITEIVIIRVIDDLINWHKRGLDHQITINLSVFDIDNLELLPWILNQLKKANLPRSALSFEITESGLMRDPISAGAKLMAYRQAGFDLSIDDFGTGYSSLSYLKNIPITELKIDKSFIVELDTKIEDQKIVKIILSLANNFNLDVVAEGVENIEVLNLLKLWGCQSAQGYYISRPISANDLMIWLKERDVKSGSATE